MGAKKNFVLDTNVILHDYKCVENFQENDIYLPIVVLEELDKFKKGSEQINYNAREFVRELDLLTSNDLFLKGASLGPGKGTLYIVTGDKYQEKIAHSFPDKTPDHRILSCALTIAEKNPKITTTLVSKDVNLRMKARSLGIPVEDYITDKVVNVDIFERAQETYENIDPDLIDKIYSSPEGVDADSLDIKSKLDPNECFILKSVRNSVLARYNPFTDKIKKVDKGTNFGIQPRNAEQSFAFEVLNDPNIKLVGLTGKAGTGKSTFLRYICDNLRKNYVVLAPSGVAAVNVGGVTIHSFFQMPMRPVPPDDPDYSVGSLRKSRKFFEERTHIRELPLSTINITNSGERG